MFIYFMSIVCCHEEEYSSYIRSRASYMYDWNTMVRFEHPPPFLYIEARALLQCVEVRNIHIVSSVEA